MHVCMHACMYACVHVCMYACMHVCMDGCMHACMDIWMYGCMDVWMYVCMCMYMYIYMCVCIYMYMYVYVYVYACMCMCVYVCVYVRVCLCVSVCLCACACVDISALYHDISRFRTNPQFSAFSLNKLRMGCEGRSYFEEMPNPNPCRRLFQGTWRHCWSWPLDAPCSKSYGVAASQELRQLRILQPEWYPKHASRSGLSGFPKDFVLVHLIWVKLPIFMTRLQLEPSVGDGQHQGLVTLHQQRRLLLAVKCPECFVTS